VTLRLPRLHISTHGFCLLAVCLLHGTLLLAALQTGSSPAPASEIKPEPVTIALIPPAPPAVSVPVAPPEPQPTPTPPKPVVAKEIPKPVEPARPINTEAASDPFVTATAAAVIPADEPTTTSESAPISDPVFDADYLRNPAPVYPKLSRQRKEQGVVLLRVHVQANGEADQMEVLQSSGYERLDEAAMRAVERWQFVPAKRGDEIVAAWVRVPVRFNLSN